MPEDHASEATPVALCKLIEQEMQAPGGQPNWRYVAVTRDRGSTNRFRVIGRNKGEVKKIKDIVEAKKTPGARVLRDQLYPVKVDDVNRTAIHDCEGKILPGAAVAPGQEQRADCQDCLAEPKGHRKSVWINGGTCHKTRRRQEAPQ